MRRIRILIWKELIELRREPRLFAIVIIAPVIQLFALGVRGHDRRPQRAGRREPTRIDRPRAAN